VNEDTRSVEPHGQARDRVNRRRFLKGTLGTVTAAAVSSPLAVIGCAPPTAQAPPSTSTGASNAPPQVLSIAVSRGINSSPIWNLINVGPKYGFTVQMSELFTYADQQRAAQTRQTDLATSGITNPASILDQSADNLRVVAGMLWGGSNIVIRTGVKVDDWKDLEGKTLGVTPGTYAYILFRIAAREHGANADRMNLVNLSSAATALEALQKSDVDGIVLFSPTIDMAVLQGLAYYPDHIDIGNCSLGPANGVILANTGFLADKTLASNFMKAYVESVKEMQNEDAFVRLGTLVAGIKPDVTRLAYKYLYFSEILDTEALTKAARLGPEFDFTKTDVSGRINGIIDFDSLTAATGKSAKDLTGTPEAALKQVRR
jgi:sulfonate transport system substrate-binding protein